MPVNQFDPNSQNNNNGGQQDQGFGPSSQAGGVGVSGSSAAGPSGGVTAATGGQGAQGNTTNQTGPQNVANPQGTSSGQFTNLQSYLNANKGYNNGQGFASQINQNLQGQANQINDQTNQAYGQFQQQAAQGYTPYDQNYAQNVVNNASSYFYPPAGSTQQTTQQPQQQGVQQQATTAQPSNGYAYNQSTGQWEAQGQAAPQDLQKWYSTLNDTYRGPTSFDPNANLYNQVQNFQQTANLANTEQGRLGLLSSMYGGNQGYNQGQQALDNLFLQSDPNQVAQMAQTGDIANKLANQYNQNSGQAAQTVQTNTLAAQDAAQGARGILQNSITQFGGFDPNSYVNQQLATASNARDTALQNVTQGAKSGFFTPDDLAKLGLQQGTHFYNLDPSQYISKAGDPTRQNVLNDQDYNKINALSNLANGSQTGDYQKILDEFNDRSQAGGFAKSPGYAFDQNRFNTDVQNTLGNYNKDQTTAQNELNAANTDLTGLQSKITTDANTVRQQMQQAYDSAKAMQQWMPGSTLPPDPSQMSDLDVLRGYTGGTYSGGGDHGSSRISDANPYADEAARFAQDQSLAQGYQGKLAALQSLYGFNKMFDTVPDYSDIQGASLGKYGNPMGGDTGYQPGQVIKGVLPSPT